MYLNRTNIRCFLFLFIGFLGCSPSGLGEWKVVNVSFEQPSPSEASIAAETWANTYLEGTVLVFENDSVAVRYQTDQLTRYAYEYVNGKIVIEVPEHEGAPMVGSISNDTMRLTSTLDEGTVMLLVKR